MEAYPALGLAPAVTGPAVLAAVAWTAQLRRILLHHLAQTGDPRRQAEALEAGPDLLPGLFQQLRRIRGGRRRIRCDSFLHGVAFLSWNQHPEPNGSRRATPTSLFQQRPGHPQETVIADPETIKAAESSAVSATQESGTLRVLLGINAIMFVVEMTAGLIAQSTGLIADSLDMFADAAVYGLALYAVGRSAKMQVRAAHLAGVLQLILAIGVLVEVVRRFVFGSEPESLMMMAIAFVALIANTGCLLLISKHREGGAHMKASWIFSANDVVINMGVIAAGALVAWTGSSYPDLIIGTIVGLIVLNGARRILALKG